MLSNAVHALISFVELHHVWAAPIVFVLAFMESLALISLVVPAWAVLLAMGTLVAAGDISFWPVWAAAALGAALGDTVSYSLGYHFRDTIAHTWPLRRHPKLLPHGHVFMERWGPYGIFLGRFTGPLRAAVPLIAGITSMPMREFQLANISSALLWSWITLAFGAAGFDIVNVWLHHTAGL